MALRALHLSRLGLRRGDPQALATCASAQAGYLTGVFSPLDSQAQASHVGARAGDGAVASGASSKWGWHGFAARRAFSGAKSDGGGGDGDGPGPRSGKIDLAGVLPASKPPTSEDDNAPANAFPESLGDLGDLIWSGAIGLATNFVVRNGYKDQDFSCDDFVEGAKDAFEVLVASCIDPASAQSLARMVTPAVLASALGNQRRHRGMQVKLAVQSIHSATLQGCFTQKGSSFLFEPPEDDSGSEPGFGSDEDTLEDFVDQLVRRHDPSDYDGEWFGISVKFLCDIQATVSDKTGKVTDISESSFNQTVEFAKGPFRPKEYYASQTTTGFGDKQWKVVRMYNNNS